MECVSCGKDVELEGSLEIHNEGADWVPFDVQTGAKRCDRCDAWIHADCANKFDECKSCVAKLADARRTKRHPHKLENEISVDGTVARISLPSGHAVLVDLADLPLVAEYKWILHRAKKKMYAKARVCQGSPLWGTIINVYLHRLLMNSPGRMEVDHANGDGLDNRRSNLRLATHSQNMGNMFPPRPGFPKGVRMTTTGMWRAELGSGIKNRYLGTFLTKEEAVAAYDAAAIERWGEFARPNSSEADVTLNRKGVWFSNHDKLWHAHFFRNGRRIYLGRFVERRSAEAAYDLQVQFVSGGCA
jgi:hypothetical protein